MNVATRPKIVVLGLITRMPVPGVIWQTVHYLVGLERLGYDVYYVEAHGITPHKFIRTETDDGSARAAEYLARVMGEFDRADRWAYHAPHDGNRYFGMSEAGLNSLYREAALIINLHGGTVPLPEHSATNRLIYLETDPVEVQIQLAAGQPDTIAYLEPHRAFFTFGENYGRPGCLLPISDRFRFQPTRQPVVLDLWPANGAAPRDTFTTIGNWKQHGRDVRFGAEVYHWSKHREFMKFLRLPGRTGQMFELALSSSSLNDADRRMLEEHGWRVRDALSFSGDVNRYRDYIVGSRAEFTVAKDQNIRLRTGWFSDRSATYLAAGRPVITQETGFNGILPAGHGLFSFSTIGEVESAVAKINADYDAHCRSAAEIAREYFSHDVVLTRLLAAAGV